MGRPLQKLQRFFRELKRRNVYKVAIGYLVAAFVALQAADLLVPETTLPAGTETVIVYLTIAGFPLALVIAWAFEMTPEGVRRTPEAEPSEEGPAGVGRRLSTGYKVLVGLGLIGAAVAGGWYLTGGGSTAVSDRSVAVLPFEAQGQEEPGTFTAGMHAALSSRLGNVSDLRVSPSRAVQAFEDTALSMAKIAGELGVAWVVTGNVQTTEEEIQVIVELVDPTTGTQRWSDDYTRDLTTESLFDLQSEISREIAQSLQAELTPEERERIDRRPTEDLDAYRLYVRGRARLYERTEASVRQALVYFRKAIAEDSSFARAWAGLADGLRLSTQYGYELAESERISAEQAARRAVRLDSTLAEAQAAYGFSVARGFEAMRRYRRAIELNPSYPQAYHWLSLRELALGRLGSAVTHIERAIELDPMAPVIRGSLAVVYHLAGRHEEALSELRRARAMVPDLGVANLGAGIILSGAGRHEEALAALDRGFELAPKSSGWRPQYRGWRGIVHARLGNRSRAMELAADLGSVPGGPLKRSLIFAALKEEERAASALSATEPSRWSWLLVGTFRYGAALASIRETPEYRSVLRSLNGSLGLNPDGSLPDSVDVSFEAETGE